MSWVSELSDPLTWAGGYVAVGVGLTASDVVGTDDEHLELVRDSPVPRPLLALIATLVMLVFVIAWPLPAAGRTWAWVQSRRGRDENDEMGGSE